MKILKKVPYRYVVASIYAAVLFLDKLDLTIVNITLPTIADYFDIPLTKVEWVNTAYIIAIATSIPISSWLGDRFGLKLIFNLSTIIFGLASLLCAYSPNLAVLSIFRFLQGFGGGLIVPVGMSLVYQSFDKREYASITSFISMPTLIAPAIAPSLGGIITELYGWQWVFLFVVPICFIVVIASISSIKEIKTEAANPLDYHGLIFSVLSLTSSFYLITLIGQGTLNRLSFLVLLIVIFSCYHFIKNERTSSFPLINIDFFKNKTFLWANLIQLCFQICHFGAIFLVSMYLQVSAGMSAKITGLVMGMQAVSALLISRYTVKLFKDYGAKLPLVIGLTGIGVLTPCILFIHEKDMLYLGITILFVRGLFSGLCGPLIHTLSIIGFKNNQISKASALFSAVRQIAIALGIALSSVLINLGFKINNIPFTETLTRLDRKVFVSAFIFIPVVCIYGIWCVLQLNNDKVERYQGDN
ncbi:MAG: DHA2 family efflux MFS transporter permease subunit [Legionellaceae bacterium]|nr:DHA2 family efflux MFS transporter permease subunit [Legionellaceae bacterium]